MAQERDLFLAPWLMISCCCRPWLPPATASACMLTPQNDRLRLRAWRAPLTAGYTSAHGARATRAARATRHALHAAVPRGAAPTGRHRPRGVER